MQFGAAFKLNQYKREGCKSVPAMWSNIISCQTYSWLFVDTDFREIGPDNYAWNVIRSEADNLIFQHAGKSGAKIFDCVQVKSINFIDTPQNGAISQHEHPGRPVSATYIRKDDNTIGVISFDYILDASGRVGLLSTKYLKNRRYNQSLKNVANWGYWTGAGAYGKGTPRENSPFFEALQGVSHQSLFSFFILFIFFSGFDILTICRWKWLGLANPTSQWNYVRRNCYEPEEGNRQEDTVGLPQLKRILFRLS